MTRMVLKKKMKKVAGVQTSLIVVRAWNFLFLTLYQMEFTISDISIRWNLGKPHRRKISVHLGIAQIAIRPPPPHSNGHSVAPIFGQNHANTRLYMDISPKNRCHKPSWQGFRPPPPNGQCPNEQRFSYGGASLNTLAQTRAIRYQLQDHQYMSKWTLAACLIPQMTLLLLLVLQWIVNRRRQSKMKKKIKKAEDAHQMIARIRGNHAWRDQSRFVEV